MSESESFPPNADTRNTMRPEACFDIAGVPQLRGVIHALRVERRKWILGGAYLLQATCFALGWWAGVPFWWGIAAVLFFWFGRSSLEKRVQAWGPKPGKLAEVLERFDGSLGGRLKAAVEQTSPGGAFNYMQQRLFSEVETLAQEGAWERCVPGWRHFVSDLFLFCAWAGSALCFFGWLWVPLAPSENSGSKTSLSVSKSLFEVTPGNAEIEKGTRFTVSARLGETARGVMLCFKSADGAESRVPMQESLGEPLYGASIEGLESDLEYWVETASSHSSRYKVSVFEFPRLVDATASVRYPEGTEPREKTFEDARKLSVPEGSDVTWALRFNKPLKSATVQGKDHTPRPLSLGVKKDACTWVHPDLRQSLEVKLQLEDEAGRLAREQVSFQIEVLPNQPPKVRPLLPRNDARFTAIEEVDFEAEVWDDTGLKRWGVTLQLGKREPLEFVLGEGAKAGQKMQMRKLQAFEPFDLKVGDSVSWFFWAEDVFGKNGVRRTESDLMLGRVRAYEEEYRQSEEEGGESGKGGPQLLEIQKQVISATWNLRKKGAVTVQWEDAEKKGVETVRASEVKVQEMVEEAAGKEEDPLKQAAYTEALEHLEKAVGALAKAAGAKEQLELALNEERAAYDALTHVAPSSYNMVRSKKSAPADGQEQTRQMSNLEFAKAEDRYESKSEAKSEKENKERKEMEDLLAQLRALARRQEEIAERMRDLEARANTSTDSSEKEAARRELKRLSEEQKALARELEDAQQKAGSKDERLSAERAQLETAREAAQKAAAAMEKGALDEARAASSRVSEKLRAGGESLRQQLSGKTREAAKELQEKAQELQEAQKKVAEALSTPKKKPPKLVAEDVRTQAAGQQQRFVKLQSEIQRVAEATESSEPIFSKALQDAHRSTLQNQTEGKLKVVNDALLMRQVEVARRAEKSASKDVEELAKALEVASNDVLGDDVESLRRARAALDEIAKTLGGSNPVAGEGTAPKDGPAKERGKEPIEGDTVKAGEGAQKGTSEGRSPKDVPDRESKGGETAKAGGEAKTETGVGTGKQGGSVAGGGNGVAVQEISDLMERLDRVEALLEKPQLRTGVARVQQVADAIRGDMKRQATKPSRNQVEQKLLAPLAQLRDAISSELARREGRESDVPVDRDPVPRKYEMSVRRYYEALGGGR